MEEDSSKKAGAPESDASRIVLLVDNDGSHAEALQRAWSQLHLSETLHVYFKHEDALQFIREVAKDKEFDPIAAIVLDPDATGEETGQFLREVRRCHTKSSAPIILWSRECMTYEVLEGRGAQSVLQKPKVLRVIQELDSACRLKMKHFTPFPGGTTLR